MDPDAPVVIAAVCFMVFELFDDIDFIELMLTRAFDVVGPILGMMCQWRRRSSVSRVWVC